MTTIDAMRACAEVLNRASRSDGQSTIPITPREVDALGIVLGKLLEERLARASREQAPLCMLEAP